MSTPSMVKFKRNTGVQKVCVCVRGGGATKGELKKSEKKKRYINVSSSSDMVGLAWENMYGS